MEFPFLPSLVLYRPSLRWRARQLLLPVLCGLCLILGSACGGSETEARGDAEEWDYGDSAESDDDGQFSAFDDFEKHEDDDPYADGEPFDEGSYEDEAEEEIDEDDWDARSERARKGIEEFNRRRH